MNVQGGIQSIDIIHGTGLETCKYAHTIRVWRVRFAGIQFVYKSMLNTIKWFFHCCEPQ